MSRPIELKNGSAIVLGKIEVPFSGKPAITAIDYPEVEVSNQIYCIFDGGDVKETVILTPGGQEYPDLDTQYAALQAIREGFEEGIQEDKKPIALDVEKSKVGRFAALNASYAAKSASGEAVALYTRWLVIGTWAVHVVLACPEGQYAMHKHFLDDIKETR